MVMRTRTAARFLAHLRGITLRLADAVYLFGEGLIVTYYAFKFRNQVVDLSTTPDGKLTVRISDATGKEPPITHIF